MEAIRRVSLSFASGAKLPADWDQRTSISGNEYYVHRLTGWATFSKPQPLPSGWNMAQDQASGLCYYWNSKTKATAYLDWLGAPPSMPPSELPSGHFRQGARQSMSSSTPRVRSASLTAASDAIKSRLSRLSMTKEGPTWNSLEEERSNIMGSSGNLPPTPPWLGSRGTSSDDMLGGRMERSDSVRVLLNSCVDVPFEIAGDEAVVARLPPGSLMAREIHEGDALVAINNHPVAPNPADALNTLHRASVSYGSVVIELRPKANGGGSNGNSS